MSEKIRTIFIGTPAFAIPSLESLIADKNFDIVAVVTQPDKKVGRKQIVTPPPVKVLAEQNPSASLGQATPVLQPQKILSPTMRDEILKLNPGIIVVTAYAQIIPESILNIPKYGCVNVHGSLLPRWRGASCVQAAISHGDKEAGVTIMKMDKGLDTGPILAQKAVPVLPTDTAGSLYEKLAKLGAEILILTLKDYVAGKITPRPQNNSLATYAGVLKKEDGKIDWTKPAMEIERFIRAMNPWPSAFSEFVIPAQAGIQKIKIIEAGHNFPEINIHKIGEIFLYNDNLAVQCGQGALVIKKLQLEGKKETTADDFLRGHRDFIGTILS